MIYNEIKLHNIKYIYRILIITHDEKYDNSLKKTLTQKLDNITLCSTSNLQNALTTLHETKIDVILLDSNTLEIHNEDFIKLLKLLTPVILLLDEQHPLFAQRDTIAIDYIIKPCTPQQLVNKLTLYMKTLRQQKLLELKIEEQNQLLIQQSKMASMGEMIGNIAHQWRQPLNALSAINIKLYFLYQQNLLNDKIMEDTHKMTNTIIQKMSETIDDFRNFFQPNKEKKFFSIKKLLQDAINFVEDSYTENNITLINTITEDVIIEAFESELKQVILNIFNNAKDAIKENNIQKGIVSIAIEKTSQHIIIIITDNGGGIANEILQKICEPYFTTKTKNKGTGLGLYMSKMIIEESMLGKLTLENYNDGVKTTITLPSCLTYDEIQEQSL
jgi:signal transduction histidine kinase